MRPVEAAAALAAVVRRQHGAFTRAQALAAGFASSAIYRRLESGLWARAHAGVYLDISVPRTPYQEAMAACLACGKAAVASHLSAARLLGAEVPGPPLPEVTLPPGSQRKHPRIPVHRARSLGPQDVARVHGVPITSAMRTIADLAGALDPRSLEMCLDILWRRRSLDPESLGRYLDGPHQLTRAGTGVLRKLVRERVGQRPAGSELETLYVQILKSFCVPLPVRQYPVQARSGRRFIDLAYPESRVAIELNGFDRHARDRFVFDDDHIRRNDLEALGWTIREFTKTQCANDAAYVAITTADAIGLAPARWKPHSRG